MPNKRRATALSRADAPATPNGPAGASVSLGASPVSALTES